MEPGYIVLAAILLLAMWFVARKEAALERECRKRFASKRMQRPEELQPQGERQCTLLVQDFLDYQSSGKVEAATIVRFLCAALVGLLILMAFDKHDGKP